MIILTPIITPKSVWKCIFQSARICNNGLFDKATYIMELCKSFEYQYNIDADYLYYTMGKLALSIT